MTERKFTDEEVIKALELHSQEGATCLDKCPYAYKRYCGSKMAKDALDLINRQRAEIERLTIEYAGFRGAANSLKMHYNNARSEAIKEFAERLKEKMNNLSRMEYHCDPYFLVSKDFIDKNAKEMTEGKPCTEGADCSTCEYCYHDGGYNECAVEGVKL